MILAFDSHYFNNKAKTVCIGFSHWTDAEPEEVYSEITEGIAAYESGSFYKRELPGILNLLRKIPMQNIDFILVDGYVKLNASGKPGLGGYLFKELGEKIPVIGVAKSRFLGNENNVKELYRGKSKKPLYISAVGLELEEAFQLVRNMHGAYRIPTLLKTLDLKTKEI